jgi:hypothetical protein
LAAERAHLLLALGAAVGLAAAAAGLLLGPVRNDGSLPEGAAATVNGVVVREAEYQRALDALASDRRSPLSEEDRRYVLGRLVDEELLVQRGLELGLARVDRRVRADLVSAVIQSVVAEAEQDAPSDSEVRAFFDENRDYFARPGRMRAQQVWVQAGQLRSETEAEARAQQAANRLRAGEDPEAVQKELGDAVVAPVPDALLPASKLREYLSPTAVQTLLELEQGEVSDPVRSSGGYRVLVLLEREPLQVPSFQEVEPYVVAEARRRSGDLALRAYLDELRGRAEIELSERP